MKKFFIVIAALMVTVGAGAESKNFKLGKWVEIHNAIMKELGRSYVDTLPIDRIERAAIDAMLAELDPYTVYVPEEEQEDFQLQIGKVYGGVGAIIYKPDVQGNVVINEPYAGSPAVKSGLRCGDEILEIDGESVHGLDSKACSDKMRGTPGTDVKFLVKRVYEKDTVSIVVTREKIHLPDVTYFGMVDQTTGYIAQSGFTEGVSDEIRACIASLKKQGMKRLVLDLRGNGGGLMQEAVRIVSLFVPRGSVVVTSKGRDPKDVEVYKTYENPVDTKLPLIVLVDSGTASSAEIVSGALQDLDRATIMGRRTFGKGLIQSIKPLPYGGQLKVTIGKYYTPSGRCVQAIDYSHRNADGSVSQIPDSLTHEFYTKSGRVVRDGGGITPDVELELPHYDDIVYTLVMRGIVEQYTLKYVSEHQTIAPADSYELDDYDGFLAFAREKLPESEKAKLDGLVREQIVPLIEEEIVIRYYFQAAGIKLRLRYDEQLKTALVSPTI
ncbi:MAG: S41 family peptidase [Bacteroidales bacterium]|nr:S41 family peptidase [Bacteroidales bacterium]